MSRHSPCCCRLLGKAICATRHDDSSRLSAGFGLATRRQSCAIQIVVVDHRRKMSALVQDPQDDRLAACRVNG